MRLLNKQYNVADSLFRSKEEEFCICYLEQYHDFMDNKRFKMVSSTTQETKYKCEYCGTVWLVVDWD